MTGTNPAHFEGKEAIGHVAEAQAKGLISSTEIHGAEIPGHISAGADSARETAIAFFAIWLILFQTQVDFYVSMKILAIFSLSWAIWKAGRSAWLAWSRLERMHRVVEQERWEIQHHRKQEKEELTELYRAKGFEGKLLKDVIEVLMADDEKLLKVMVEEELCLSLGTHEHPLKQALGAFIGAAAASLVCLTGFWILPQLGVGIGSAASLTVSAALSAYYEGNRMIPAVCWNLGLGVAACGTAYFLFDYVT
ncbi:putative membrane protein [Waddlia chondrophila 2032/99]|uniref:Putative membrane protein n=2 Tax=Waddlia chondrophila TaxID=71667 RepID=D6YSD3_WADCW|nr:VIT1/CCC1 transporter family protein [Waddlia chondrophila]ADI38978.1 putative membrane protein [Waddlia chondrophila WSU 86-1044]CCB92099.1 putative membrane protein [Waddlia chondrophila 2032/99]